MIIGLSGYARSGKDEAAKGLEFFGFQRVAFADKLRDFLYLLNPIIQPRYKEAFSPLVGTERVQWIIDKYGWGGYKETPWGPEIRELLQRLGTECGRELIYQDIWVDAALDDYRVGKLKTAVITDVRFPNEAEAIKEQGGYLVRIERPGVGPANAHPSETALDDWDFDAVLNNDGPIEQLHHRIGNVALAFAL